MKTTRALWKISRLWEPLDLPAQGPDFGKAAPPRKPKDNTWEEVQRQVTKSQMMYEESTRKWALALYRHCSSESYESGQENPGSVAREWIEDCLKQHIEHKTEDHPVEGQPETTPRSILTDLLNFQFVPDQGKIARSPSGSKLTVCERTWAKVLNDDLQDSEFNFIFRFSAEALKMTGNQDGAHRSARARLHEPEWLNAIGEAWEQRFDAAMPASFPGNYLLFRADERLYYEPEEPSSRKKPEPKNNGKYGWFGKQKILVIPVALLQRDGALMWEDVFPNPRGEAFESRGAIVPNRDGTLEVFGVDSQIQTTGKFMGILDRPSRRGARGVMFGRDTGGKKIEAYRFWLCEAEDKAGDKNADGERRKARFGDLSYAKVKGRVDELIEEFSGPVTVKKRREMLDSDEIIVRTIETFLESGGQDVIFYLFSPADMEQDDLHDPEKVSKIGPRDVSASMLKANLDVA